MTTRQSCPGGGGVNYGIYAVVLPDSAIPGARIASISAALVMESGLMTSKFDPEKIEPGKWRIDTGEAARAGTRMVLTI